MRGIYAQNHGFRQVSSTRLSTNTVLWPESAVSRWYPSLRIRCKRPYRQSQSKSRSGLPQTIQANSIAGTTGSTGQSGRARSGADLSVDRAIGGKVPPPSSGRDRARHEKLRGLAAGGVPGAGHLSVQPAPRRSAAASRTPPGRMIPFHPRYTRSKSPGTRAAVMSPTSGETVQQLDVRLGALLEVGLIVTVRDLTSVGIQNGVGHGLGDRSPVGGHVRRNCWIQRVEQGEVGQPESRCH